MGITAVTAQILKPVTSTTIGVGAVSGSNLHRLLLTEFICGSDAATLGTSNFRWELQRSTTTATGTSVSVNFLTDVTAGETRVSSGAVLSNLTANGTLTSGAIMLTIALAQQATFRWVANPGYEIIISANANNGIHWMTPVCGGNPSAAAQITYEDR